MAFPPFVSLLEICKALSTVHTKRFLTCLSFLTSLFLSTATAKHLSCSLKPAMARVFVPLAGFTFLAAALFGSVLGQAPSPAPMSVPALTPSPMFVPSPESGFGPAPPPGPDCETALLGLADCLTYVQLGSNLTKPDQPCCPALLNLVGSSPICLCKLLQDPKSAGFNIDVNRALKLPSLCKTPSVSVCSGNLYISPQTHVIRIF